MPTEAEIPGGTDQLKWMQQDLAVAPEEAAIVFGTHFLPSHAMLRLIASLGAKVVLSGHWYDHMVR